MKEYYSLPLPQNRQEGFGFATFTTQETAKQVITAFGDGIIKEGICLKFMWSKREHLAKKVEDYHRAHVNGRQQPSHETVELSHAVSSPPVPSPVRDSVVQPPSPPLHIPNFDTLNERVPLYQSRMPNQLLSEQLRPAAMAIPAHPVASGRTNSEILDMLRFESRSNQLSVNDPIYTQSSSAVSSYSAGSLSSLERQNTTATSAHMMPPITLISHRDIAGSRLSNWIEDKPLGSSLSDRAMDFSQHSSLLPNYNYQICQPPTNSFRHVDTDYHSMESRNHFQTTESFHSLRSFPSQHFNNKNDDMFIRQNALQGLDSYDLMFPRHHDIHSPYHQDRYHMMNNQPMRSSSMTNMSGGQSSISVMSSASNVAHTMRMPLPPPFQRTNNPHRHPTTSYYSSFE